MNGITEQDFIALCNALNESIANYRDLETLDKTPEELNMAQMTILLYVDEIIDQSQGKIRTDDENLAASFNQIFEAARGIKQNAYFSSHDRSVIRSAKNDKEMDGAIKTFNIHQKLYQNYLDKAYNLTAQLQTEKTRSTK